MSIIVDTMEYSEIVKYLIEIEDWINSKKIETRNTRFSKIKKSVEALSNEYDKFKRGELYDMLSLGNDLENCMYEAVPFIEVYIHLKNETRRDFLHLLKTIVKGPDYAIEENDATNEARNNLFNLHLAAKLVAKGFKVKQFNDIVFDYEGYEIPIQCKRPRNIEKLGYNIGKANGQFYTENHMGSKPNMRGIIAISVEKMLNLENTVTEYSADNLIEPDIHRMWENIVNNYRQSWAHLLNQKVLALFFYFKYMSIVPTQTGKMLTTVAMATVTPLVDKNNKDVEIETKLIYGIGDIIK